MAQSHQVKSLRSFLIIWSGQFVSIIGSALTSFALGVWIFQQTGRTTDFALIAVSFIVPGIVFAPIAGSIIDRYNRRIIMLAADMVAGISTIFIMLLFASGQLSIWHIYVATILSSSANAFQSPAYAAVISQLIDKAKLARANGLVSLARSVSDIAAPVIAGFLVVQYGLWSVLALDFFTFVFAVVTLAFVSVPDVIPDKDDKLEERGIIRDTMLGWRYIRERPSLLALLIFNGIINIIAVSEFLVTPLVLSFSSEDSLGIILGLGGLGFLLGSLVMSITGGPKRLIIGITIVEIWAGLATLAMGLRPSIVWISVAIFLLHFSYPIISASNLTLWQRKIPNAMQGRILATRQMLSWLLLPIPFLLAGPIVDSILQPMMQPDGVLASSVGQIIGVGDGRGIALMMIITGGIDALIAIIAFSYKPLREIETILPDANPDLVEA